MLTFRWEFSLGFCLLLLLFPPFLNQPCCAATPKVLQPRRGEPGTRLSAWAGSAPLCACKHSVSRKCGVSSASVPLNFLHPMQWGFLFCCPSCSCFSQDGGVRPSCKLCFLQSSLVAYLTSASLPRFFVSQAFQSSTENAGLAAVAASNDSSIHGSRGVAFTPASDLGSDSPSVTVTLRETPNPSEGLRFFQEKMMPICSKGDANNTYNF